MTREERRRLLDAERKLAFGAELSAVFAKWGYKRSGTFICIKPMEDGDKPIRFALDYEGDLIDPAKMEWGADTEAKERKKYEDRVAAGLFDSTKDTMEEDGEGKAEKPKPEPKPEKSPLTLPLTDGQKVVIRDGRTATIGPSPAANYLCRLLMDDGSHLAIYRDTGTTRKSGDGPESNRDAMADAEPEPVTKPKRKAKAKLTLPLTEGQRVTTSEGQTTEISEVVNWGSQLKARSALGWFVPDTGKFGRANYGTPHRHDLVADA